jgi:hypothetical protein
MLLCSIISIIIKRAAQIQDCGSDRSQPSHRLSEVTTPTKQAHFKPAATKKTTSANKLAGLLNCRTFFLPQKLSLTRDRLTVTCCCSCCKRLHLFCARPYHWTRYALTGQELLLLTALPNSISICNSN